MVTGEPIKHVFTSYVLYMWLGNVSLVLMIAWYFMGFPDLVLYLMGGLALVCYIIQVLLETREKRNVKSL